jgi:hypothetical protein
MNKIEFKTAGAALQREKPHTRRWVTKISSGYCGVNKWMYRWKKRDTAACPRCHHPLEDVQHVWLCQGMESTQKWEEALTSLNAEMVRLQTDPVLATVIINRLRTWQRSEDPTAFTAIAEKYKEVINSQDTQGWCNYWVGLPSKGWQEL